MILSYVKYWNFFENYFFKIYSNPFHVANSNQNEEKITLPSLVCHGLPENAFQVNQLYNVTWSTIEAWHMAADLNTSEGIISRVTA